MVMAVATVRGGNSDGRMMGENCSSSPSYPRLPSPGCQQDGHTDEAVVAVLIIALVLYTFYRLLHEWSNTLNFRQFVHRETSGHLT